MKKIALFALLISTNFWAISQEKSNISISVSVTKNSNSNSLLSITAKPINSFKILSIKDAKAEIPLATVIEFDSTSLQYLKGFLKEEGKIISVANAAKPDSIHILNDEVTWVQEVNDSAQNINGIVKYMLLNGEEIIQGESPFSVKIEVAEKTTTKDDIEGSSNWDIFLLCFWLGIGAMFTPCVFPLIPVTVSFFLKKSKTKGEGIGNSIWYSISIVLIYVIPTLILVQLFGEKIMYQISTHYITNILFFVIFILFGISLLGGFELTLPNKWANAADKKTGRDFKGIFFMALTLVIVSFSCTGPIIGSVLSSTAKTGSVLKPVFGMLGVGVGLALPFSFFAIFPNLLKSLPKSGGWLNAVKVCFGFIELALALKFLSNVDLIFHWGILNRDVFLVIWIVLFALMGIYLLGKIKFSHDSEIPFLSIPRLLFAIATFSFSLYLVPGLWGAPLQPLSGFIPPATTQDFNLNDLKYSNNFSTDKSTTNALAPTILADKLHVPFGLKAYFDLNEGMAAAKVLNKPVMLDFTGHSCANCRKMEEQVWKNSEVLKRLKNDFVLISLYVDESTKLPIAEQFTNAKGDKIQTYGDKNLEYEITKFGFNAQPLYMFLDLNGNVLSNYKYGYDASVDKFIKHLDDVTAAFQKAK